MARLPVDPMFARALLKAEELGCASEMCAVAAMVSTDHVFFTPRCQRCN